MGSGKLGLKLIGTNAIVSIIVFFLMVPLMGLWENNQIYQWIIGLIFIIFFWLIVYSDINHTSQNDIKRGFFWKPKGFLAGVIASIPTFVLFMIAVVVKNEPNYAEIAMRIWLAPYTKVFVSLEEYMPYIAIIPIILLPIIAGLSYLDGPRRRQKILDAIKESDAMRAEKSKVDR